MPGDEQAHDVIIVGGGVAGCEAARRTSRAGRDTLLVTTSLDTIHNLFGDRVRLGPPAGTLLADIGARAIGPDGLVRSQDLHRAAKAAVESWQGLRLVQSNVTALRTDAAGNVTGVSTWEGVERAGRVVALCVGSFLGARLRVGSLTEAAGRLSEMAYDELRDDLHARGARLRTVARTVEADQGALAYEVRFEVFDPFAVDANSGAVVGYPGLFAAGACVDGATSYARAAADGARLGDALVAATA